MFATQSLVEQSSANASAQCYGSEVQPLSNKQKILNALQTLEDDATFEEAIECIKVLAAISTARDQFDAGQWVTHEEIKRRFGL